MLAAGVILLMAAVLAADVVLSSTAISVIGPPTGWTGDVLRSEMTGSYPVAAAIRGYAPVTGYAVYGVTGGGYGVFGTSSSNAGVRGISSSGTGGHFTSSGGYGVYANTTGTAHYDHGVYASASNGYGVFGKSTNNDGVRGEGGNIGVRGIGSGYGIFGTGTSTGVYGGGTSGYGVYGSSSGSYGVYGYGSSNYGGYFSSGSYRGLYARGATNYFDAYFNGNAGIWVARDLLVGNDIIAYGSKAGYVVDLARNDGEESLRLGDVVVIVGAADPVLGEIPVPTVRLADETYSTGVMGVVDRMFATPAVQKAIPAGLTDAQERLDAGSMDRAEFPAAATSVDGGMGRPRAEEELREVEPESPGRFLSQIESEYLAKAAGRDPGVMQGAYVGVVTLGAFKAIRVDASYGSILPGDLLVSSPTAGHAMRANDPQPGTIIGKALGSLEEGQGTVPVLITLH
jgi:hypothetical protein